MDEELIQLVRDAMIEIEDAARAGGPDLEDAPVLEQWAILPGPSLIGRVKGHPRIRDGALAHTSLLVGIADDGSWARTLNRFYRLGRNVSAETLH